MLQPPAFFVEAILPDGTRIIIGRGIQKPRFPKPPLAVLQDITKGPGDKNSRQELLQETKLRRNS